jgi:hypothetical protein
MKSFYANDSDATLKEGAEMQCSRRNHINSEIGIFHNYPCSFDGAWRDNNAIYFV